MPVITLTTDFGLTDAYVGIMKGVIVGICPRAQIVDLTHGVTPGDVRGAALILATAAPYFPRGTIHLAVVDPGVGSARAGIVIRAAKATFVGPDNGILDPATKGRRVSACRRIENPEFCLPKISATFHGRDVFAPVAAHLACGRSVADVGPAHRHRVLLDSPKPVRVGGVLRGEVIAIDRFGNAITNVPATWLPDSPTRRRAVRIRAGRTRTLPLELFYAAVPAAQPLALPGSSGFLEISVNQGSAASQLKLVLGSKVTVRL